MSYWGYIKCDREGCREIFRRQLTDGETMITAENEAETAGWFIDVTGENSGRTLCPECREGRTAEQVALIRGGLLMLEGFRRFDGGADCYPAPCRTEAHYGEGCLIHVHGDEEPEMEGSYVMIVGSGCGSYHAQMVSPEGEVTIASGNEVWWR